MSTGAALSALTAGSQMPVQASLPQSVAASTSASPSQFQNIYQNLPGSQQDSSQGSTDQTQSATPPPQKKRLPADPAQTAVTPVATPIVIPTAQNVAALSLSLPTTNPGSTPQQPDTNGTGGAETASFGASVTQTALAQDTHPQSQPTSIQPGEPLVNSPALLTNNVVADQSLSANQNVTKGSPASAEDTTSAEQAKSVTPLPALAGRPSAESKSPKPAALELDQNSPLLPAYGVAVGASPTSQATQADPTKSRPADPVQIPSPSAATQIVEPRIATAPRFAPQATPENFAFSLRLTGTSGSPAPEAEQHRADELASVSDSGNSTVPPAIHLPTPARPAPSVQVLPDFKTAPPAPGRNLASSGNLSASDTKTRDLRVPLVPKGEDTRNSEKPSLPLRSALSPNESPTAISSQRPAVRDGGFFNAMATEGDSRAGAAPLSEPSAPVRPSVFAQLSELHPLAVEPARVNGGSDILLHVENGAAAAAVRVVDRGGAINVTVHATDAQLRTTLRSNLSDLTTQLNTQGLRTETVKTTLTSAGSENRPDQGDPQQRSFHQPQSPFQGERNSQRDRRGNDRWLEEFDEQTSNTSANPGGKNS